MSIAGGAIAMATFKAMQRPFRIEPSVLADDLDGYPGVTIEYDDGEPGPPAGYPALVPGEMDVGEAGSEIEPWGFEDPGPVPDTPFYIFHEEYSSEHPHCGFQHFGTMNKCGVDRAVYDALPNRMDDYTHIGQDNPAREAWLAQNGHEIPAGSTWKILVTGMGTVNGDLRLKVLGLVGKDKEIPDDIATYRLDEIWSIGGETPTLLHRIDKYIPGVKLPAEQ